MDPATELAAFGLVLPTPAYIIGAILFGLVGLVGFRRGRKTSKPALTWASVTLMIYPYAVSQDWILWGIGIGLCGWLYAHWN